MLKIVTNYEYKKRTLIDCRGGKRISTPTAGGVDTGYFSFRSVLINPHKWWIEKLLHYEQLRRHQPAMLPHHNGCFVRNFENEKDLPTISYHL